LLRFSRSFAARFLIHRDGKTKQRWERCALNTRRNASCGGGSQNVFSSRHRSELNYFGEAKFSISLLKGLLFIFYGFLSATGEKNPFLLRLLTLSSW
jgi:hypothetical protein